MSGQPIVLAMAAVAIVAAGFFVATAPVEAASEQRPARAAQTTDAAEAYAQAQPGRARTRIRVSPRCYYRTKALPYPPPYECEAPGPGYVRQCNSWLVQEARPSGTVIVPRMQCWWERG